MIAGGIVVLALALGADESSAASAASVGGAAYDSKLSLDWQPGQSRSGKPLITGYVNTARAMSGYCNIRLFIETLDAQGNVIASSTGFIPGYVNTARAMSGYCNIRLFIETLDAQGNVIASSTAFVPGYVGGDDHVYFEVPIKVAGPAYRVSADSWLKCAGGGP